MHILKSITSLNPAALLLITAVLLIFCPPSNAQIAVFDDAHFPYYCGNESLKPKAVVDCLKSYGFDAQSLSSKELSDPEIFNAGKFQIFIHVYGNTFPLPIIENLRRFHKAGGSIISAGVPFCHPCVQTKPAKWSESPSNASTVSLDEERPHSGKRAIKIRNDSVEWAGAQSVKLHANPGEIYRVSGWVMSQGNTGQRDFLFVRFFAASGKFITQSGPAVPENADEWRRIELDVTAPEECAVIDVSLQVWSKPAAVWLDDVSLVRIEHDNTTSENLLPNNSFEEAGGAWTDLGHNSKWFSHEKGSGTGGFLGPAQQETEIALSPNDPLGLSDFDLPFKEARGIQWLNARSLPVGDGVVGLVSLKHDGELLGYPAAIIKHRCKRFNGAIDVWLGAQLFLQANRQNIYVLKQIIARSVAYILREKKLMSNSAFEQTIDKISETPKPSPPLINLPIIEEKKSFDTLFPKSQLPAEYLRVADVSSLPPDERFLLTSLQGIVNRKAPRIYLIFNNHDKRWLKWMQQKRYTKEEIEVSEPMKLLEDFRDEIKGMVITDPDLFIANDIAAMVAGVQSAVVASPRIADELHLPAVMDLRGQFKTNAEALRWTFKELYPKLNHHLAMCAHPDLAYNGTLDYMIEFKGLVFWITGRIDSNNPGCNTLEEMAAMEEIFAAMPVNVPVRGFWWHGDGVGLGEGAGVELGGELGKLTVVSDGIPNLSVHSGVPSPRLKQKRRPTPDFDANKVYLTFTMSDGDNLNTLYGYFTSYFEAKEHGEFPMGWGMGPTGIDLMPAIIEWYYEKALPGDEFFADVSGVGYIYPETYGKRYSKRQKALDGFLDLTRDYMAKLDMHAVRPHGGSEERMARYAKRIPGLTTIVADYGRRGGMNYDRSHYFVPAATEGERVPVFHALTQWGGGNEGMLKEIKEQIGDRRPAFANVFVWNWGYRMPDLKWVIEQLGDDFVVVTPSELSKLYERAMQ